MTEGRSRRGHAPQPPLRRASSGLRVRVVEAPEGGRSAPLPEVGEPGLVIGSRPRDGLAIQDAALAERHVVVERVAGGARLCACEGCDVFIGPLVIRDAVVPMRTRFRIGDTTLELVREQQPESLRERMAAEGFIYADEAMTSVAQAAAELAPFNMSVLIQGETGTGKEVVARAMHRLSLRSAGPFEIVDCGALPANLVESELFGHERGAYTGAATARRGAFERAHGGTLLLDEIGELPLLAQPVLLGVLQRRRLRRVGGERDISVDVRVLAATNRSLEAEIDAGRFRRDLFYRLASARIDLPPLRQRRDDIAVIAEAIIGDLTGQRGRGPLDEIGWQALLSHDWPGNVRELRAVLELAVATGRIQIGNAAGSRSSPPAAISASPGEVRLYRDARAQALADFERHYLSVLIDCCNGNASKAARVAEMDRPHLLRLLRRHGLR